MPTDDISPPPFFSWRRRLEDGTLSFALLLAELELLRLLPAVLLLLPLSLRLLLLRLVFVEVPGIRRQGQGRTGDRKKKVRLAHCDLCAQTT